MTSKEASRHSLAANLLKTVACVLGSVLLFVAIAMVVSALVSALYAEYEAAMWIAVSAGITAVFGYGTRRLVRRPESITVKQGFATVGMAWFVFSIFGALPYLLTGAIPGISDAVFETASGFTTTGASILPDPSVLPHGISFWRAMTCSVWPSSPFLGPEVCSWRELSLQGPHQTASPPASRKQPSDSGWSIWRSPSLR